MSSAFISFQRERADCICRDAFGHLSKQWKEWQASDIYFQSGARPKSAVFWFDVATLSRLLPVTTFSLLAPVKCFPALGANYASFSLTNAFLVFDRRIIVPLFKMLDMLFSNGCFELLTQDERYIPWPRQKLNHLQTRALKRLLS